MAEYKQISRLAVIQVTGLHRKMFRRCFYIRLQHPAQLIVTRATAVFEMDLPANPNFKNDSLAPHLERQATLPNESTVPDHRANK